MGQRSDLAGYRLERKLAIGRAWHSAKDHFKNSSDGKMLRSYLEKAGVQEPYLNNIMERVFIQAYSSIEKHWVK